MSLKRFCPAHRPVFTSFIVKQLNVLISRWTSSAKQLKNYEIKITSQWIKWKIINQLMLLHGMLIHYFLLVIMFNLVRNKLHLISARCRWYRYAALLPVWRRRQYDVTHGVNWWTWVTLWISINLHWSITDKYYVPTNSSMMHITSVRCGIHTVSHNWHVWVSGCYIAINVEVNHLLQRFLPSVET